MRKRAGSGVSGEPESRAMVDPFETGEWWFFNVFHGILLLGIYDEKYVRIFLFDHVPIEWLEMVDGWSGLLLVILVWLISTRKWVITQVASRPSRVTRPYLTHLGWNRFLQPQLLKSGNIPGKTPLNIYHYHHFMPKIAKIWKSTANIRPLDLLGPFLHISPGLQAPTIPPQSTALMQGRHGSEGEVSRFFVKGANPRASRKGLKQLTRVARRGWLKKGASSCFSFPHTYYNL